MPAKPGTVQNPYHYDADDGELERFLMLCLFVAGKKAAVQQEKLDKFIDGPYYPNNSVIKMRGLGKRPIWNLWDYTEPEVTARLMNAGAGQYRRLTKALRHVCFELRMGHWQLASVTRDQLVECPGLGLKTASFFLMYTREDLKDKLAVLDTHILRWMREEEGIHTPKSTPQGDTYLRLEHRFLEIAKQRGKCPSKLDFEIWEKYSKTNQKKTAKKT